jgi:hypothetical protein
VVLQRLLGSNAVWDGSGFGVDVLLLAVNVTFKIQPSSMIGAVKLFGGGPD